MLKKGFLLNLISILSEINLLLLIFCVPLIFTPFTNELFEWPKMMMIYLFTILALGLFLIKAFVKGKLEIVYSSWTKILFLFLGIYFLATIFSINFYTSFWGYYSRFNGSFLSLLAYFLIFHIFLSEIKTQEKIDRFLKTLLFSSLIVSSYGVLQRLGIDKDFWVQHSWERVFSTLGQPNWLASFLGTIIPLNLAYLLIQIKQLTVVLKRRLHLKKLIWPLLSLAFYLLLCILSLSAFYFTRSRSGYLGLLVSFLLGGIILFFKLPWRLKILALGFSLMIILSVATLKPSLFSFSLLESDTTRIRNIVWQGTLNLIKDHPITGTGPETFAYSFLSYRPAELNQTTEWDFVFNKPHNEYLGIAAGSGLLSLILYLGLIVIILFLAIHFLLKRKTVDQDWFLVWGLITGLFCLWLTNFFGFSVVTTQLLFFLFPALIFLIINKKSSLTLPIPWDKMRVLLGSFSLIMIALLLIFWFRFWQADVNFVWGKSFLKDNLLEAEKFLGSTVSLNPWEPRYREKLAYAYSERAVYLSDDEQVEMIKKSALEAEKAYHQNPHDYILRNGLIKTYLNLALLDAKYFSEALNLAQINIEKSPTNPYDYYFLATLDYSHDQNEKARTNLQKALELKPDYAEAQNLLKEL